VYHEIPLLLLKLTEVPLLLIRDFAGSQNADIRGGAPAETGAAGAAAGAAGAAMPQAVDTEAGPPVDAATGAPGAATGAAGAAISEPVDLSMDSSLDGIPGTWTGARARANYPQP